MAGLHVSASERILTITGTERSTERENREPGTEARPNNKAPDGK